MKVGDLVLVPLRNDEKELGTILKIGCRRKRNTSTSTTTTTTNIVQSSSSSSSEDEDQYLNDGILVKTNISMYRAVYSPDEVVPYKEASDDSDDDDEKEQEQEKRSSSALRRTTRRARLTANYSSMTSQPQETLSSSRSVVTPSPVSAAAPFSRRSSILTASEEQQDDHENNSEEEEEQESAAEDRKPAAKRKRSSSALKERGNQQSKGSKKKANKPKNNDTTSYSSTTTTTTDSEQPTAAPTIVSPFFGSSPGVMESAAAAKKKKKKPRAVRQQQAKKAKVASPVVVRAIHHPNSSCSSSSSSEDEDDENGDNYYAPPRAAAAAAAPAAAARGNNNNNDDNSDNDDDDLWDRPYTADYAPTGRATCRRCDERILKGMLRISHIPLFRGKPGFRVYRHLSCATFSEEIRDVSDVGGWHRLTQSDQEALAIRIEESIMEMEEEEKELQPDELVQESFQGEMRESPKGLTASLLPFQKEGASWMYCQEVKTPDIRGGILADEMGMGKTLQTITSILDNRPILQHSRPGAKHPPSCSDLEARKNEESLWKTALEEWKHEMDMINVPPKIRPKKMSGARAGTLVVCPVIALSQWKTEIEKFTEAGTLRVGIYHGPNRASEMPAAMMQKYDVVLTTYQVVEQDFRKMVSPNKITCPNCGGKFKIDKLRVHLMYFCGEAAQRTEAQARQQRGPRRGGGGGGSGSSGKGKKRGSSSKKPPMTKAKKAKKAEDEGTAKITPAKRKTVRVPRSADYESDSELSVEQDFIETPSKGRPSRSAAVLASKKVKMSAKEWNAGDDDDESSFASLSEDDDSDSEDTKSIRIPITKKNARRNTKSKEGADPATKRALEKQRKALEAANISQKTGVKTSKPKEKGRKGKGKGKKKRFDDSDPSSSDDNSGDDMPVDPMADIDMKELMEEAMAGSRFSPLHSFCWWRIVLDEAHFIKSRSSQTAAAAFSLTSIHRWCLSGTPLQNRVGELYSLIRFLRINPMAHYFCRQKDCSCKSLHYRMVNGICQDCGHRAFSHFAHFNKHVLNPIQRDGYSGDGRRAMFKLKNEVLDKCLLRRTKETKAADLELPPRLVTLRSIRLHPVEEDFYNALYTQTKSSFDDYVAEGTLLNNYAHIFDLLTKMRQAVNHPYLIVYSKTAVERNGGQSKVANGSVECDMCHEPPTDRVLSSCCGAGFCRSCVVEYLTGSGGQNTPCPSCQAPFTIDLNQESAPSAADDGTLTVSSALSSNYSMPSLKELLHVATGSILRRINLAEFATSTKVEVLVQELIEMRQKRPGSKALVFSQFVNMLDLVRWRLHSDAYLADLKLGQVKILHGGMDVKSRDEALRSFREDPGVRVLLMSLKSAGVALNLTAASEVYLLDLWWNPSAEQQALDRVHRIGQHRPIRAVRFVAEGTVEERVLQLQEKKRLVFDGTVGRDAGSLKMLTADDMKALFT